MSAFLPPQMNGMLKPCKLQRPRSLAVYSAMRSFQMSPAGAKALVLIVGFLIHWAIVLIWQKTDANWHINNFYRAREIMELTA
jgi:hypothetical protein